MNSNTTDCADGLFGPTIWAQGCRGGFDFTLAFEESILTILPAALFIALASPRLVFLLRRPDQTQRKATYNVKIAAAGIYAVLQIVLLALVASSNKFNTQFSIAATVLTLLAAILIIILSHAEHVKSVRPSFILSIYLFVSLLFDVARVRTEWLRSGNKTFATIFLVSTLLKLALLSLESVEKRQILLEKNENLSKESTSGPFNRGFFVWLNSLLMSGWATALTNSDLPTIYEELSSKKLLHSFSTKWDQAVASKEKPSLTLTTFSILKWDIAMIAFPRIIVIALVLAQPFLITSALNFLTSTTASAQHGYGLIGAFALVFFGSAITTAWYEHLVYRAAGKVRGGLITLVYRKMTKMSNAKINESSAVALMGNDVETLIERVGGLLIECWANAATVVLAIWLLAEQLGAICVVPVIACLISLAATGSLGKVGMRRQIRYQKATEGRINFTSEVLGSFKSVKILGYGERFMQFLREKRDFDLSEGKAFRWIAVWSNGISNGNIALTQVATFGAYAIAAKLRGIDNFTSTQAITTLSILTVLTNPLSELLGYITKAFNAVACFRRIQEFLLLPERSDDRLIQGCRPNSSVTGNEETNYRASDDVPLTQMRGSKPVRGGQAAVAISEGSFGWDSTQILDQVTTSVPEADQGSLTMIVGPVGSGKSTLLDAILGETGDANGVVSISTAEIAFCSQTPWILNATVQENIIAGTKHFDEKWYKKVIEACDLLLDFQNLPQGDQTLVGDKGLKLSGGQKQRLAIARAVYARKHIAMFDDPFSGLDKVTEEAVFTRVFSADGLLRRFGTTVILATHAVHRLPQADYIIALGNNGSIIEQGTYAKLRENGDYVKSLSISDSKTNEKEDEEVSCGSVVEETAPPVTSDVGKEDDTPPSSDRSTFKYYFASMGKLNLVVMGFCVSAPGIFTTLRSVWLTWWGDGQGHESSDLAYWLSVFAVLAFAEAFFVMVAITYALIVVAPLSGKRMHEKMLVAVMNAPMDVIMNAASGSLLNRFSQDMRFIDFVLPVSLVVLSFQVCSSIGTLGLAIAAVSWIAITVPIILGLLVLIQRFYVRTSKQLRLLEIENKAPLYGHFDESIHGLATIRAYNWTNEYMDKTLSLLDASQKPYYLLNAIQRWLTLVLDMVISVLITILVAIAVGLKGKIQPGLLGVALVQMMTLGLTLKDIILQWSTLETSLGAVTRVKTFVERTPSENLDQENRMPAPDWLSRGKLEVKDVSIQYGELANPVVRDMSFSVKHGQRVGICGRSGSGKSSTIQALLRIADISKGQVLIDGEDISKLPRSLLRSKLSCLTQEPFLFSNTIRFNADPLAEHTDEEIVNCLKRVGLWSTITSKFEAGSDVLSSMMTESSLSHGQRQLFCLGRALLKRTAMMILDEPTSSVDHETDALIQQVIRSEFADRTIIMIAHRLDTLLDFDKIAVLEDGCLVEFDNPQTLLAKENGSFSALYNAEKRKSLSLS